MTHDHSHAHDHGGAAVRAGARHVKPLALSFALIVVFLAVQVVVGIVTGSLALLSDAGHMATDALGLGMAIAAIQAASRGRANPQRTFGLYRLEILAAFAERGPAVRCRRLCTVRSGRPHRRCTRHCLRSCAGRRCDRARHQCDRVPVASCGCEGEPQHARRVSRSGLRHARVLRGDRCCDRLGHHRLDMGRSRDRRGDRCVHPATGMAARP